MQPSNETVDLSIARAWTTTLFVGLITIAVGVIVLAWPDQTLKVLSVLFGIQLLLFGMFRLISAFSSETLAPGLVGLVGVIGIVAGVVVIRNPFETVTVLVTVLGAVWIIAGLIDLIAAIADSSMDSRWWIAFAGLLSILAGVVVVSWPSPTITVIAWIAGLYFVVLGILISITGIQLRSVAH